MIYKVFSDERYSRGVFYIGGIVCTQERAKILNEILNEIKIDNSRLGEYKWTNISNSYVVAYEKWIKAFFEDPHARFIALRIYKSSPVWVNFEKEKGYREALKSVYYQFLIGVFKTRQDDKIGWEIYHDFGFFSNESDIKNIEFKLNRIYKRIAPHRRKVISISQTVDSKIYTLVQLSDVLLGAFDFILTQTQP